MVKCRTLEGQRMRGKGGQKYGAESIRKAEFWNREVIVLDFDRPQ